MPKRGYKHSEKSKEKMKESQKKRFQKFPVWNKGKRGCYSKEYIEKLKKANLGKHLSKETREKMSKNNGHYWLGKRRPEMIGNKFRFKKGNIPKNPIKKGERRGKKTEFKKDLIPWNKGKKYLAITGSKNKNWKGGISPINKIIKGSIEYKEWREKVFKRDNWVCQKYRIKGCYLHPHHIQNFAEYPELRFDVNNGITLSKQAHDEFHKIYGRRNNTKEQLEKFLRI